METIAEKMIRKIDDGADRGIMGKEAVEIKVGGRYRDDYILTFADGSIIAEEMFCSRPDHNHQSEEEAAKCRKDPWLRAYSGLPDSWR